MRSFLLIIILVLFYTGALHAQYNLKENNIWFFGYGAGLDFNSGSPVSVATGINHRVTGTSTLEAAATVCDISGNLLFHTEGSIIWDRAGNIMPNAAPLHSYGMATSVTQSTTQGVQIVEMIDTPGKYYLFSLAAGGPGTPPFDKNLYYSVVDMNLNGGMGDVVPGRKWIHIDTALTEKMIAIPGDNCDIWLLAHSYDENIFKAYRIGKNGFDPTPIISRCGVIRTISGSWVLGQLCVSTDRKKLATANFHAGIVELYDFDPATGTVSNSMVIDTLNSAYGISFSPDNSKLYVSYFNTTATWGIYQFNLNLPNKAAITASKTFILPLPYNEELRIGPNEKIYFISNGRRVGANWQMDIGVIQNPNLSGTACNALANVVTVTAVDRAGSATLGNYFVKATEGDTITQKVPDTTVCDSIVNMQLKAPAGYQDYRWNDGTRDTSLTIVRPGKYWVSYNNDCITYIDTFIVNKINNVGISADLGADTILCGSSFPFILDATDTAINVTYLWQDGSTNNTYTVNSTGTYWVELELKGCTVSDTIQVAYLDLPLPLGNDTVICNQQQTVIIAHPSPGATLVWGNSSTDSTLVVTETGGYTITVSNGPCSITDTIQVRFINLKAPLTSDTILCSSPFPFILTATTPGAKYLWYDGSTDSTNTINKSGAYWVEIEQDGCYLRDTIRVRYTDLSQVLGSDTVICNQAGYQLSLQISIPERVHILWQDGSTNSNFIVTHTGYYWVTLTDGPCAARDTISVRFFDLGADLGRDTVLCFGDPALILDPHSSAFSSLLWQDGSSTTTFAAESPGTYWVIVSDAHCTTQDTIVIQQQYCNCMVEMPTAFTPNGDGKNDIFRPIVPQSCPLQTYMLQIYSRWGELIFSSHNTNLGWDGTYKGHPVEIGTYQYQLNYATPDTGEQQYLKGDVTLIR